MGGNSHALYIAGLPMDTQNVDLYRLFAPFGAICPRGVHAMRAEDGSCKGIAFVNFVDEESARLAIATYNGVTMPDGTALKVSLKQAKPDRQPEHVPPQVVVPPVEEQVVPKVEEPVATS